jgi:hypothetical protein
MSSCVRVPLSPARDRYQTRRWAACSLQQAIQIAPSERSGHKSRSAPEHARSTVPARPARILVLEGDHPGGTERARRRRWPPNMQPRIVTPHVSASPAPSARRTGVLVTPQPDSSRRRRPWHSGQRPGLTSIETRPRRWLFGAVPGGQDRTARLSTRAPRVITSMMEAPPPTHHRSPAVPRRTPSRVLRPSARQIQQPGTDRRSDHPSWQALRDSCSPT